MASVTSGASAVLSPRAIHPGIYLGEEIEARGIVNRQELCTSKWRDRQEL